MHLLDMWGVEGGLRVVVDDYWVFSLDMDA